MRNVLKIAFLLAAAALTSVSCVRDADFEVRQDGQRVTITLDGASLTRSGQTNPGTANDRAVKSLRVLGYDSQTNRLVWDGFFDSNALSGEMQGGDDGQGDSPSQELLLNVYTGTYDVVFIANEPNDATLDPDLVAALADESNYDTMGELRELAFFGKSFPYSWSTDIQSLNPRWYSDRIPMVTHVPKVEIIGNNTAKVGSITYTDKWPVALDRVGVRLDINLTLTATQYTKYINEFRDIYLYDLSASAYIMPRIDNYEHVGITQSNGFTLESSTIEGKIYGYEHPKLDENNDPTGEWIVSYSILMPERILGPVNDKEENAASIEIFANRDGGGDPIQGTGKNAPIWYLGDDGEKTYSLPRNTFLELNATVEEDDIVFTNIIVIDWEGERKVNMSDRGLILPTQGVPAAPGVLGVNARTGELTLVGSREYKNTSAANGDANSGGAGVSTLEFGPISNDQVFTAYFKWGSLVGVGNGANVDEFEVDDVMWAPEEYNFVPLLGAVKTTVDPEERWAKIVHADNTTGWPENTEANVAAGLGDPCWFASGGTAQTRYMTPRRTENGWNDGLSFSESTDNGPDWGLSNGARYVAAGGAENLPINGAVAGNGSGEDWSMFMPFAGRSDNDGLVNEFGNQAGIYWASTPFDDSDGYNIHLQTNGVFIGENGGINQPETFSIGLPIRCVPFEEAPLPVGVHAAPGILGYVADGPNKGQITLRGSSAFAGTPVEEVADNLFPGPDGGLYDQPVYIARFKFGSLVAYSSRDWQLPGSANDGVWLTPDDIIAAPEIGDHYIGLDALKAQVVATYPSYLNGGNGGTPPGLPNANRPGWHNYNGTTWWSNPAEAWGDPCDFYSDKAGEGEWRIPTKTEWYDGKPSSIYNITPNDYTDALWIDPTKPEYNKFPESGAVVVDATGNPIWSMFIPMWYELKDGNMGGQLVGGYWLKDSHESSVKVYPISGPKGPDAGAQGDETNTHTQIRPVRCLAPPKPTLNAGDVTFDYWGGTKQLNVSSLDADGTTPVAWEVVGYDVADAADNFDGDFNDSPWVSITQGTGAAKSYIMAQARGNEGTLNDDDTKLKQANVVNPTGARHDVSMDLDPSRRNTANTYVINAAGRYKLPLVYGNAIKDGAVNTAAFTSAPDATNPSFVLQNFVGYDDLPIPSDGQIPAAANNATVVWQDAPGLVLVSPTLVTESGMQFIEFDVPNATITAGNAMIAVRNAAGTIMWSWQIWVTPADRVNVANPEFDEITSAAGYKYKLMKANLGYIAGRDEMNYGSKPRKMQVRIRQVGVANAQTKTFNVTQDSGGIRDAVNEGHTYYQWGRKDPMPAVFFDQNMHWGGIPSTKYYGNKIDGTSYVYGEIDYSDTGHNPSQPLSRHIQNPMSIIGRYYPGYDPGWNVWDESFYVNLWDTATNTSNFGKHDNNVVKTIYDPSPAGYKMPPGQAFSGMKAESPGKLYSTPAQKSNPIYFPVLGLLTPGPDGVGTGGFYWTAASHYNGVSDGYSYGLSVPNSGLAPTTYRDGRAKGFAARPIQDIAPVAPAKLTVVPINGDNVFADGSSIKQFSVTESSDGSGNDVPYTVLYPNGSGGWTSSRPAELSWVTDVMIKTDIKNIWVTLAANPSLSTRSVTLLVRQTSGDKPAQQEITVTQDAALPFIEVSSTSLTFEPANSTTTAKTFTVTSNTTWSMSDNNTLQGDFTVSPSSGTAGTTTVTVRPTAANTTPNSKLADLTFATTSGSPGVSKTVKVMHKSDNPIASIRIEPTGEIDSTEGIAYRLIVVLDKAPGAAIRIVLQQNNNNSNRVQMFNNHQPINAAGRTESQSYYAGIEENGGHGWYEYNLTGIGYESTNGGNFTLLDSYNFNALADNPITYEWYRDQE
ncbi:MAG: hypothetical protein LBV38_06855 [Alistipes sp.]|jgi:hypothetical protein|nr:hypothetical protein [Alistipes sp.]